MIHLHSLWQKQWRIADYEKKKKKKSSTLNVLLPFSYRAGKGMAPIAILLEQRQRRLMKPETTVRPQTPTWLMFQMGKNLSCC